MSGFAVAGGPNAPKNVDRMMERIAHRGPYVSGTHTQGGFAIGQNYLRADCPSAEPSQALVPVAATGQPDLRIAYDGEIGNVKTLANDLNVADGPFLEERVVLELYRQRGPAEMFESLADAIFAFAIADGDKLLVARDLLGIKTLFHGQADGAPCFASELKSLTAVTDDVHEFPAGHTMSVPGQPSEFARLPESPPELVTDPPEQIMARVREIIESSFRARVSFERPTACLLSGGMDSSAITCIAAKVHRERFGDTKPIRTYAIGSADSGDLAAAREVAAHVGTDHHEVVIDLNALLEIMPKVIHALESFDPSLVRSAASNYLISRHAAADGYEVLLSGEGGDELFCGYAHLKDVPQEELFSRQIDLFRYLHNNASLRLDRTNQANSIRVITPLICGPLFDFALRIPPKYKVHDDNGRLVEKWIFRKAYEDLLPRSITDRLKQEFSQGSGSAKLLTEHFEQAYSDAELAEIRQKYPVVRNKEEMHYFRIFIEHFGDRGAVKTVGQWQFK